MVALYFPFPRVPSMPFLLVMILCCKHISYCLVRGAPIAEDVPHDPVVALLREEGEDRLPFMSPPRATRRILHSRSNGVA